MRLGLLAYLGSALALYPASSYSQVQADSLSELTANLRELGCTKILPVTEPIFSGPNGNVRLDPAAFCMFRGGREAFLFGTTAAMVGNREHKGRNAPWIHIEFRDRNLKAFRTIERATLAQVTNCGGYYRVMARMPPDAVKKAYDVRLWMGNSEGTSGCDGRGHKGFQFTIVPTIAKVIRIVKSGGKCSDCSKDEKEVYSTAIKALGINKIPGI